MCAGVSGLLLLAAIGLAQLFRQQFYAAALEAWVHSAGPAGPLLFMFLYAGATALFLPGPVVTLAGGALFGPAWGTLWNLTGATTGAALDFLIARHLGTDWVERRAGPKLKRLSDGVVAEIPGSGDDRRLCIQYVVTTAITVGASAAY